MAEINLEKRDQAVELSLHDSALPHYEPVLEFEDSVVYMGVALSKRIGGPHVPDIERFKDNAITNYDLKLMQKIAIALDLNQAVLIEAGSGLGKTETIERMCAQLNWECYYANCHDFEADVLIGSKTAREDTKSGFGWKDGIVIQAIRNGGVLFLDEYNFMRGETRGRLHEVLDAILRGKNEVVLIENDGERIPVHPEFRLVAAQNPPGGEFSDREVLDPAQFTRFVYLKEHSQIPKWLKLARSLKVVGAAEEPQVNAAEFLAANADSNAESIRALPEISELIKQFIQFEETVIGLVERGILGEDQPQKVYFAFQRDFNRLMDFVTRYYDGDIYETFKGALRYYYSNRFETYLERKKVEELISTIVPSQSENTKRQALPPAAEDFGAMAA